MLTGAGLTLGRLLALQSGTSRSLRLFAFAMCAHERSFECDEFRTDRQIMANYSGSKNKMIRVDQRQIEVNQ